MSGTPLDVSECAVPSISDQPECSRAVCRLRGPWRMWRGVSEQSLHHIRYFGLKLRVVRWKLPHV
eukprot:scaffold10880_cov64-Phaeocystis_antarctica.AAC.10